MNDRAPWDQMTFEELVAALEQLTDRMGSGEIGIEEVADLYEQAEMLHGLAAERLAKVQARIDALAAKGASGTEGTAGTEDAGNGPRSA